MRLWRRASHYENRSKEGLLPSGGLSLVVFVPSRNFPINMVSLTASLIAALAAIGTRAAPADVVKGPVERDLVARSTPNAQGTSNGFFYQFCTTFLS